MNSLAAAVLLHLGGKTVDENGIKAVLNAAYIIPIIVHNIILILNIHNI
jgi:ribosomal protein L12E/L44/L45/RPP1/RPP2